MPPKRVFFMEYKDDKLGFCHGQESPYKAWVSLCRDKQVVRMTVQEQRHPKTQAQLGFYYAGILPDVCAAFHHAGYNTMGEVEVKMKVGVRLDTEVCDMILKQLYQTHIHAEKMPLKRNFSDAEMSQFIEFIHQWVATNLNATIQPPRFSDFSA